MDSFKEEAEAFDKESDERIKAGHIPDLRRLKKVDWFINNMWRDPEFVKIYLMPKINFVLDIVKKTGGKVLHLGCGRGYLSLEMARNGLDITAVDISPKSIAIAKRFAEENKDTNGFGSLNYLCENVLELDFEDESFDSVVFFSSLHHMPKVHEVMQKVEKFTKKGGNLVIVEPLRGEFTKKSAEYAAIMRLCLPTFVSYADKIKEIEKIGWEQYVQKVYDEYTFKGEHEQSPHDNLVNTADMVIDITKKYFKIKETNQSGAFLEKMIGALRGADQYAIAKLLDVLDKKMVEEKALPFTSIQVHAIKE